MTFVARQVLTAAQLNDLDINTLTTSGDVTVGGTLNATISAAGSDGQIQYNNGGSFGGASALYYDDVNNRVGIGTTSPASQFHVDGGASGAQARITASGADTSIAFLTEDQQNWSIGIDESDAGKLKIGESVNVGTVTRVTIDSSGNVGIGDTTPSYTLDVNGTGRFTGDLFVDGTITGNGSGLTSLNADNISSGTFPDRFSSSTRYNIGYIDGNATSTFDKLRVWNSAAYTIGMVSGLTYGHLNDYAMTFRMNNDSDRGFWWGDDGHGVNGGAMSLTTNGRLTVATSLSVGQGESITSPSAATVYIAGSIDMTGGISAATAGTSAYFNVVYTDEIGDRTGQQLILGAGESQGKFSGQTGELVYANSESGLAVYTPDGAHPNFNSGYVTRVSVLNGEFLKIFDGPTWYQSTQDYGTFNVQGYTRGSYYGVLLNQDANFMMNTAQTAAGVYWDSVNTWMWYSSKGSHTRLHYNGSERMRTETYGVYVNYQMNANGVTYNDTVCGGAANRIAFRWANPYVKCSVDNVICADAANFSDARIKTDITSWSDGMDMVRQLRPVTYRPKDIIGFGEVTGTLIEGVEVRDEILIGLIAQEVREVLPSAVHGDPDGTQLLSIAEDQILAVIISAVQNIDQRLSALEATV